MIERAQVTKVDADGVYVEIPSVAPEQEFGPCPTLVEVEPGDQVLVSPLGGGNDEWAVLGVPI